MKRFSTSGFRSLIICFCVLTLGLVSLFYGDAGTPFGIWDGGSEARRVHLAGVYKRPLGERLDLREQECRDIFPELLKDIDYASKRGKFVLEKENQEYQGLVQGRIEDNKLYILTTAPDKTPQILHQRTAILSQLHRALVTSPTTLPNTHFAFTINDTPKNNSWAFARPNKYSDYNIWLMPPFALWSWPLPTLGAFSDLQSRISALEATTPWERKIDKSVWRGTPWFNPVGHPQLRQDLLRAAKGREWADVRALDGSEGDAMPIEEFCGYKYVVYTEGVTYSGRLVYHQGCGSVLLMAPLGWVTSTAWMLRPILARDLLAALRVDREGMVDGLEVGDRYPQPIVPTVRDWRDANAVYVSPDFSDLEEVIMLFRAHPEVAKRIAQNQREKMVGGGYLSGAAETCYWRALIKGWAHSAVVNVSWEEEVGERYEAWLLKQVAAKGEGRRATDGG